MNAEAVRDQEVDLVGLLRALWARRWMIAALTAVGAAIALVYAFTADTVYRAAIVVTDARETALGGNSSMASKVGGLASLAGLDLGTGSDATREAHAILSSRRLVELLMARQDLYNELNKRRESPMTQWRAVEYFRKNVLSIREDQRAGLTTVTIEWDDPARAAQLANAFIALANEVIRTRALDESTRNITYLKEQIAKTNVVELQRVMYNLIENETKTNMLANARPEYAFTTIDPAVAPEMRVWPRRSIVLILGVLAGFTIGALAALTLNALSPRRVQS